MPHNVHQAVADEATHDWLDEREPEGRPRADEYDDPTYEPAHVLDEGDEEYERRTTAADLFGPYMSRTAVAW